MIRDIAPKKLGYAVKGWMITASRSLPLERFPGMTFIGNLFSTSIQWTVAAKSFRFSAALNGIVSIYTGGNRFASLCSSSVGDSFVTTLKLEGE